MGLPRGSVRYLTREDLLRLPQVSYTVSDDANFSDPTKISGVSLDELRRKLAASPDSDMVAAICVDRFAPVIRATIFLRTIRYSCC